MTIRRIGAWRWLFKVLHALILLGTPFIKIEGQSALRFDIPSLRLFFFGKTIWMDEFFIVLVATLFLTFFIVFVTVVFGRLWCGWLCPQTVINDLTGFVEKAFRRGVLYRLVSYGAIFLICLIIAANLVWYFVSPYEFFSDLLASQLGNVTWGFWLILTLVLFLNFTLVRRKFCATVCPYARAQGMLYDSKTLIIAFDTRRRDECMDCRACVQVCPVGIDIRKGANIACINCAECVDKCGDIFRKKGKKGLINYFWGEPGSERRIIRQNSIITGALMILSLVFLFYLTESRQGLDVTIVPDYNFGPRFNQSGELINAFLVSVENRQKVDDRIDVKTSGKTRVSPDRIYARAGEHQRIRVFVIANDETNSINLSFFSSVQDKTITKEITLLKP